MVYWKERLASLNAYLEGRLQALDTPEERRRCIQTLGGGEFRQLSRRQPQFYTRHLGGRPLVGVDGSISIFGGDAPHYVALIRAAALPASRGDEVGSLEQEGLWLYDVWSPLMEGGGRALADAALQLRRRQTALEAEAAVAAASRLTPSLLLIDGGLVRFCNEAKESFRRLITKVSENNTILVGVTENVESTMILRNMGAGVPAGWAGATDRALLWGVLEYGELLKLTQPLVPEPAEETPEPLLRRWFLQSSHDGAAIGLDFLDAQVQGQDLTWVAEYLLLLTPEDGRGIPVWLDMVDRQVRITQEELLSWVNSCLGADVRRRLLSSKRSQRPRF